MLYSFIKRCQAISIKFYHFLSKKRPRQVYLGLIGFNQLKMLSEQRGCHGQGKYIE